MRHVGGMHTVTLIHEPSGAVCVVDREIFMYPPSVGEVLDLAWAALPPPFNGFALVAQVIHCPGPCAGAGAMTYWLVSAKSRE